jgi:MATE family multidrug resistance protein
MLKYVFKLSFTQILNMLMFKVPLIINAFFISLAGYYGIESFEDTQAIIKGIGLGNIIISILCFGISFGLNSSLETVVAYAYGCSMNLRETDRYRVEMRRNCGLYLNIARLVNTMFMIFPTAILFLFMDEILITFFKQNAFVSETAIQYCIIIMPGVWAMTQFDATKKFLSAQKHGSIPLMTQLFTSLIQVLFCYLFII